MADKSYKEKLFDIILNVKDLQDMLDACSELIDNPLIFANQSLQIIRKSSSCDHFPEV